MTQRFPTQLNTELGTQLRAQHLFDGNQWHQDVVITIADGKIQAIEPCTDPSLSMLKGKLVPGFFDIQVNGGGDRLFNADPSAEALAQMFAAHTRFGTTAMLPTVITDDIRVMSAAADAVAEARQQNPAGILGIHFEGPHIAEAKKGAHCAEHIRPIGEQEWQVLARDDLGAKLLTLAPETVSPDEIRRLTELGVKVFLGHSNASFEQARAALDAGAVGFTHLYNAMSAMNSRAPGMVGAALLDDDCVCGLIVDGHHVDYAACRLAIKAKGIQGIALVTDAMPLVGSDKTSFTLVDREVTRTEDGRLLAHSGELAGSILDMASAVRNSVQYLGASLEDAIAMATVTPARVMGLTDYGYLAPGAVANLVLLNDELEVQGTWVGGVRQ